MGADAGQRAPARAVGGDVDEAAGAEPELEQDARAVVRRPRIGSAREHGGHEATVLRQASVSDGEHAAMHAMQPAARDAPAHRARAQAQFGELASRDHTVLAERQVGDAAVNGVLRIV